MFLELAGRNQKQQHQINEFSVKSVEFYSFSGEANCVNDIGDRFIRTVGYCDAKTDSCGLGQFSPIHRSHNAFPSVAFNLAGCDKMINQFANGFLAVRGV